MVKKQDVTILLLGETGVGKSTWINGFANFLQYQSLEEAEDNETLCLIPSLFSVTDENYKERLVQIGSDKDEVTETGKSATQYPQTYSFHDDEFVINLIDTPGIGDVRGIEQDKKNFEHILDHIANLRDLNAICILLKPNNARLNVMFRFCIKELLTHLHKDACRNIVFCFTNTRGTFYKPGDTLPALRQLLSENRDVIIPLDQTTIYCMDNEAIRFLYAVKGGISFSSQDRDHFMASWKHSVKEVGSLLNHTKSLTPHVVRNTLSLNNARKTGEAICYPLAEVTRHIQRNIGSIHNLMTKLKSIRESKGKLEENLYDCQFDLQTENLPEPRTVCTSRKCIVVNKHGPVVETIYKTHCHVNCGTGLLSWFGNNTKINNIVGHKKLKKCSRFNSTGTCKLCGCSYLEHMRITYETRVIRKLVLDWTILGEIKDNDKKTQQIEEVLSQLQESLTEWKAEQLEITNASVKFTRFLKMYAITPFNDSIIAYIDMMLRDEKYKSESEESNNLIQRLEEMKQTYLVQMKRLQDPTVEQSEQPITPSELENCIKSLYTLKHSGRILNDIMTKSRPAVNVHYKPRVVKLHNATDAQGPSILRQIMNEISTHGASNLRSVPVRTTAPPSTLRVSTQPTAAGDMEDQSQLSVSDRAARFEQLSLQNRRPHWRPLFPDSPTQPTPPQP